MSEGEKILYYLSVAGAAGIALCICTISLGIISSWIFKLGLRKGITIANETGIQNVPLALTITATILANPHISIVPAAYGFVQILFFIIVLALAFGPWSLRLFTIKDEPASH